MFSQPAMTDVINIETQTVHFCMTIFKIVFGLCRKKIDSDYSCWQILSLVCPLTPRKDSGNRERGLLVNIDFSFFVQLL